MRSFIREFWILVVLTYIVLGISIIRAEERPLDRAVQLVNEGRPREALPLLRREVAQNPRSMDAHVALGVAYLEKGDYNRALAALEKALVLKPQK